MKFLVDNQLSLALARHLEAKGVSCRHASDVSLAEATDHDIWNYAAANDSVVISKDEDFLHLSIADPSGPAFIWVRLGNCRKPELLSAFDEYWDDVLRELQVGNKIIEIR